MNWISCSTPHETVKYSEDMSMTSLHASPSYLTEWATARQVVGRLSYDGGVKCNEYFKTVNAWGYLPIDREHQCSSRDASSRHNLDGATCRPKFARH